MSQPRSLPNHLKAVLFDLDGTVVDHFTTIWRCINYACDAEKLSRHDYDQVRRTVGGSIDLTIRRLTGIDDEERIETLKRLFRSHFDEIWTEDLQILPGAKELITRLHESDIQTAIFTNKEGSNARKVCDYLELTPVLDAVVGTLDAPGRKPDPAFTQYALHQLGAEPKTTVLVGDSPFDIETARNAQLARAYVVTTGTHGEEELAPSRPDGCFSSLGDLDAALFASA